MEGEEYFCPKINRTFKVSTESYELCSDCRHSDSAKFIQMRLPQMKKEKLGESLLCCYGEKSFEIPIPQKTMVQGVLDGLARIIREDREVQPNLN